MRLIFSILVCLACTLPAAAQDPNITGKWLVEDDGDTTYFELAADGFFIISNHNETIGGKNYWYVNGHDDSVLVDCKYKVTITPALSHLFFVMYRAGTNTPYLIMPVLYRHMGNNSMQFAFPNEEEFLYEDDTDWDKAEAELATASFGEDGDIITLTRVKPSKK